MYHMASNIVLALINVAALQPNFLMHAVVDPLVQITPRNEYPRAHQNGVVGNKLLRKRTYLIAQQQQSHHSRGPFRNL